MAQITLKGSPISTSGDLPANGSTAPDYILTAGDLSDVTPAKYAGQRILLNIFPSVDTATCAASVRRFNVEASKQPDTTVICVSMDLPFALSRFCAAEGLSNVVTASAFRSSFGKDYGLNITTGPLRGLLARAVVVIDGKGVVRYGQLVPEIATEPDYAPALAAGR